MSNGFKDEGIHFLSIKNHNHEGSGQCIHSLGIISQRNVAFTNDNKYALVSFPLLSDECIYTNHFNGFPDKWINGEILTVKLDLNAFNITYFKNGQNQFKVNIPKKEKYFFAMHLCASDDIKMEIVDNHVMRI